MTPAAQSLISTPTRIGPPELAGRKVLVVGLGLTGLALAGFLLDRGAVVTGTDGKDRRDASAEVLELEGWGVRLELGGHREESFLEADLIAVSPGVPHDLPPLQKARERGVAVTGEIELASRFITAPVAAVTGTNGKTTTTRLLGDMLEAAGRRVYVGGNIGAPLIDYVRRGDRADVVVAEISSFQLETAEFFRPAVAVLLNVTPDHLDRHGDLAGYLAIKARLFARQNENDFAVLNADDPLTAGLEVPSRRLTFSRIEPQADGAYLDAGRLVIADGGREKASLDTAALKLTGAHNQENVMAAALAALALGADPEVALAAAARFKGLAHRLELVGEYRGVSYYDDSKGTNVGAVEKALAGFDSPVILIAGGRDKDGDFERLRDPVRGKVRLLILIGEAREKMVRILGRETETVLAEDMAEAVTLARDRARPGDAVVLSPGCASFDMYRDYKHRGEDFVRLVKELCD